MMGIKRILIHLSQFKQNTPKLYRPRMVRGNEIDSALATKRTCLYKTKDKTNSYITQSRSIMKQKLLSINTTGQPFTL